MDPLVTIILPNYNHSKYLIERLDSVFNQSFQDFEVIILDDASTDNSLEILNSYRANNKVKHFIVNEINSGSPFRQWLKGLMLAKGEYVWIAETDDFSEYNFLETQIEFLEKADLVVAKTKIVDEQTKTNEIVQHPIFSKMDSQKLFPSFFLTSPIKNVSAILFKRPKNLLKDKIEFINYSIMGDQVFYYEFFMNSVVSYNAKTISYFRRVSSSVSNSNSSKSMRYFLTHYDEHLRFSKLLEGHLSYDDLKRYKKRHFNKMKNNTSKYDKINLRYFYFFIKSWLL
ncbi:glycosyltransferase family 2 protein [Flavobacterium adhaerens]|uniref:glycosyltransferase family 2 protein n=1 Tax=Flavobacterium adhaerens TaxID=3149043 RepID=UPI0032B5F7F6